MNLCDEFVWNWRQELWCVVLGADDMSGQGCLGVTLAIGGGLSGSLSGLLLQLVLLDAVQEIGSERTRRTSVFKTYIQKFRKHRSRPG